MELNGTWLKGDWIQTFTGKQFWPLEPVIKDIDIDDIAHALSLQCRYGGHCRRFYSVAEHCVHVSTAVPAKDQIWGLLHDAAEAYLVDVPRPIKKHLSGYKEIEANLMRAICARFGLDPVQPESVTEADNRILFTEREALLSTPPAAWDFEVTPLPNVDLRCWQPRLAEDIFRDAFHSLQRRAQ